VAANTDSTPRRTTVDVNNAKVDIAQDAAPCRFTVSPSALAVAAGGGAASVSIEASAGSCSWNAATDAGWIHVGTASGSGSGTVKLTIDANGGAARSASVVMANQPVAVTQADAGSSPPAPPAPACTYSLSPSDASIPSAGGNGSIGVTAGSACTWSATANAAWISITGAASGTGNGTVAFSVASNNGGPRSGTITIGDRPFTVTQGAASCSFSINPSSYTAAVGGGSVNVTVTLATGTACSWTASSSYDWLTIASVRNDAGGGGSVTLGIAANPGGERSGKASIAGQTLNVTERGCTFSISPSSQSVAYSGGGGSIAVTANGDSCAWTARSSVGWITLNTDSGHGNSAVQFTAAANTTRTPRSGTVTVAAQTFTVNQDAAPAPPCSFTVTPSSLPLPAGGGSSPVTVTASDASCSWTATVNGGSAWLTLSAPGGTGSGTVAVTAAANPGGDRTASITVANQTVAVTQPAVPPTCTFTVAPTTLAMPAAGGSSTIAITASDTSCAWAATVTSGGSWLSISGPASGTGSGSVGVSAAANSGPDRAGSLTVAGQAVSVTQPAPVSTTATMTTLGVP
jgi:Viral BACON domain/Putative binding domain, N-terminal